MARKIAVVVRDRQEEAFRMAVGTILLDDTIDVFVLDRQVEETEENRLYMETIRDLEMNVYSNVPQNSGMQLLTTTEMAEKYLEYDHVLAY